MTTLLLKKCMPKHPDATSEPIGYEAPIGHRVLVGPDPDGQGGSFGVVMGDEVRIVSTNQVGKLIRRRLGSYDDRVVVLVDGESVETQAHDVMPWDGVESCPKTEES